MTNDSIFEGIVFVTYRDHVLYNRAPALAVQPQVRRAVGWLVYECEYYVTISWDRDVQPPTLHGGDPKASGMVLLKGDILELRKLEVKELPLQKTSQCHLNLQPITVNSEYALQPKKRKTQKEKERQQNDHSNHRTD